MFIAVFGEQIEDCTVAIISITVEGNFSTVDFDLSVAEGNIFAVNDSVGDSVTISRAEYDTATFAGFVILKCDVLFSIVRGKEDFIFAAALHIEGNGRIFFNYDSIGTCAADNFDFSALTFGSVDNNNVTVFTERYEFCTA